MAWYWIVLMCVASCAAGWIGACMFGLCRDRPDEMHEIRMLELFRRVEAAEHRVEEAEHILAAEREQTREAEQRIADALHGEEVR